MPKLSIIVPVYKVEAYLPRCLDSILAQTFTDFELILIDDGSPDRCGEIMEEYAKRDSRIVTIHQENQGVSAARNAGLTAAKGNYIGFVDPDDWIDVNMYELMLAGIKREGVDIACCPIEFNYETPDQKRRRNVKLASHSFEMSRNTFLCHVFDYPRSVHGSACNKVFRRSLIQCAFPVGIKYCEDYVFLLEYCKGVEQCYYSLGGCYQYLMRTSSASHEDAIKSQLANLTIRQNLIVIAREYGEDVFQAAEDDYLDSCCLCCGMTQKNKDEYYYEARRELRTYLKENWLQVLQNKRIPAKKKLVIAYWALRSLPVAMNKRA